MCSACESSVGLRILSTVWADGRDSYSLIDLPLLVC